MADKLVAAALQEIAAEGVEGCAAPKLWTLLQAIPDGLEVHLDDNVKQVVWRSLLSVQGMSFKSAQQPSINNEDPSIQNFANSERLGVVIVASQELRDACLGLYDIKHADTQPSQIQHSILERLAKARTEGVTQNQLGKDFNVEGNKLFYILRSLESRGLVVRRSTLVRTRDTHRGAGSIVLTNLVHLTRYAKHLTLNSHQRFEISNNSNAETNFDEDVDEAEGSKGKQLMINDDLPAMKAICEKLDNAEGKILVVSDLKLTLGYRLSAGHRAWRRLMKRLKEAGFVNVIDAKVGRKVRSCIQLIKPFNEQEFNTAGNNAEADAEQQLKGPKRGQITEQLTELSVDQQIYDMIEEEGPDGLMMMDVWKRVGLNNKRNYYRIQNMTIKHGIRFEAENHKRSTLYRLRTLNSKRPSTEEDDGIEMLPSTQAEEASTSVPQKAQKLPTVRKRKAGEALTDAMVKIDVETDAGNMVITNLQSEEAPMEIETTPAEETSVTPSPSPVPSNFPPPSLFRIGQPYPCLTVTVTSLQREAHIMERLQEEKFVVRAELHRWLESISNRTTMMDRKTLTRTLQKLQTAGRLKCVALSMPGSTNCGRKRQAEIVCLPEVEVSLILDVIHDRIRKFDMESRGHGIQREKAPANSVPVLDRVTRMAKKKKSPLPTQDESGSGKIVALQVNGFVPAKMVRVRMLHHFLWSYTNDLVGEDDQFGAPRLTDGSGYRVFNLVASLHAMPLELFLQVVGSNREMDNLADRCRQGLRICDLPEADQGKLLENSAGGRLAWLIDILRRLKLIRIVIGHGPVLLQDRLQLGSMSISMIEASLTYAMEEHIYMEEPAPQPLPSLTKATFDMNPRGRHDFSIDNKESLDNYWQTLEYFFSGAEPSIARHAFPGSSVPELFGLRSWTSLRIMTVEQRNELVRRMNDGGPENRKSIQDCAKIAKDLNLTLEQVLRVSYEKNRRARLQSLQKVEPSFMETFASHAPQVEYAGYGNREDVNQMFTAPSAAGVHVDGEDAVDDGEDSENHISIVTKLKPSRSRRFPWSDKLDRVLFFAYARQRALLGAKMNRVDWNNIHDLPAIPIVCRRRMSILKAEPSVKKAILNLCSLLAARYETYCQLVDNVEDQALTRTDPFDPEEIEESETAIVSASASAPALHEQPDYYWDNPEDPSVLAAIDEIIRCKNLVRSCYNKPCYNRRATASTSAAAEPAIEAGMHLDPAQLSSAAGLMQGKNAKPGPKNRSSRRSRKKVKTKPANLKTLSTEELVLQSVGVANAVEFIKLVLLNSSVTDDDVQLPKSFMDALHQFKETHVLTAFNYLRDHNMVASGQGAQSFVLSETFTKGVTSSRFPVSTGEEALAACNWLQENKADLDQDWIPYDDVRFGGILHLLSKVFKGELQLAPKVPTDGVGESEDPRTIACGFKRKAENEQKSARNVKARLESQDEIYQAVRRERGFPGIDVLLHTPAMSLADMLTFETAEPSSSAIDELVVPETNTTVETASLDPELLDAAALSVQKAGEEGLTMGELARSLSLPDDLSALKQAERYAEALESAGKAKMVNAFDHVRVLAEAHAAPYLLQFPKKKSDRLTPEIVAEKEAEGAMPMEFDVPDMPEVSNTLPVLPWLTSSGTVNPKIFKALCRRILGIVALSPGITQEQLVEKIEVLNPQTVKELLRVLELEGKLRVRKASYQNAGPPSLLMGLLSEPVGSHQVLHYSVDPVLYTVSL